MGKIKKEKTLSAYKWVIGFMIFILIYISLNIFDPHKYYARKTIYALAKQEVRLNKAINQILLAALDGTGTTLDSVLVHGEMLDVEGLNNEFLSLLGINLNEPDFEINHKPEDCWSEMGGKCNHAYLIVYRYNRWQEELVVEAYYLCPTCHKNKFSQAAIDKIAQLKKNPKLASKLKTLLKQRDQVYQFADSGEVYYDAAHFIIHCWQRPLIPLNDYLWAKWKFELFDE